MSYQIAQFPITLSNVQSLYCIASIYNHPLGHNHGSNVEDLGTEGTEVRRREWYAEGVEGSREWGGAIPSKPTRLFGGVYNAPSRVRVEVRL